MKSSALIAAVALSAATAAAQYAPQMPTPPNPAALQPMSLPVAARSSGTARDFPSERVDFGVLAVEVPQGWRPSLHLGDTSMGGFAIRAEDPNRRFDVRFAHNWNAFLDQQVGGYFPGNQVVERILLPQYAQEILPARLDGVLWRSPNTRINLADPASAALGLQMPLDSGTLAFGVTNARGERLIGTVYAETLRIVETQDPLFGTSGMYTLRIATLALGPAEEAAQRFAARVLEQMLATLTLAPQYMQTWQQSFAANQRIVADLSNTMSTLISQGYARACESQERMAEQWSIYMRGGQYAQDPTTGENHWITNDQPYWFVDPQGNVAGNATGQPPSLDRQWRPLTPVGL